MSGWTEIEIGNVKLKHHSTSSLIEMIITTIEELEQGKSSEIKETIWIDYETFSDIKKAMNHPNIEFL